MKLNKCFTTVFSSVLLEKGFKKKGVLYYRMNGDILQGITIKLINPYSITFAYIPYWIYDFDEMTRGHKLSSSYWAEYHEVNGSYYNADDEKTELIKMQSIANVFSELIIPFLDGIFDLDTYISSLCKCSLTGKAVVTEYEKKMYGEHYKWINHAQILNQYAMLYKAFCDGSFRSAERTVNDFVLNIYRCWYQNYYDPTLRELIDIYYKEFYKHFSNKDLNWIVPIYEEKCAEMKQRLREELKLEVE